MRILTIFLFPSHIFKGLPPNFSLLFFNFFLIERRGKKARYLADKYGEFSAEGASCRCGTVMCRYVCMAERLNNTLTDSDMYLW